MLIVAFVTVPLTFLQELAIRNSPFLNPQQITFNPATGQPNFTADQLTRPFIIIGLFALIQYFLIRPFLTAATIHAVARGYLGDMPTVEGSYKFALSRLGSILWVILLQTFAIFGVILLPALLAAAGQNNGGVIVLFFVGFIAALVFAVIAWIRWSFGTVAVVVEEQRGTKALGRSWRLSKDFAGKIFGALFVAGLIAGILSGIFAAIPSGLAQNAGGAAWFIRAVGNSIASIITTPFITIVVVLLYFDLRIRKEGLDLAVMAQELQRSGP
jgi:hypothetical protein